MRANISKEPLIKPTMLNIYDQNINSRSKTFNVVFAGIYWQNKTTLK